MQAHPGEGGLERLRGNRYPGRGLVIGRCGNSGNWLQVYWLMGRSPGSRGRRLVAGDGVLRIEPVDISQVKDPSLVVYEAMLAVRGRHVVGNGDQVRTVHDALAGGGTFENALMTREREPDAPHYTPRIAGMLELGGEGGVTLAILKANPLDPGRTDRIFFRPAPPPPGFGLALHTYEGDGSPLPPFEGEPRIVPLDGGAQTVLDRYWSALDPDHRVALAVKEIGPTGAATMLVRNRI